MYDEPVHSQWSKAVLLYHTLLVLVSSQYLIVAFDGKVMNKCRRQSMRTKWNLLRPSKAHMSIFHTWEGESISCRNQNIIHYSNLGRQTDAHNGPLRALLRPWSVDLWNDGSTDANKKAPIGQKIFNAT